MRSYIIDEILSDDMNMVTSYLEKNAIFSGMKNLYWVELPVTNLNDLQKNHIDCHPHRFAVEIGDSWIKAEFYIRTGSKFKCDCSSYCNENQIDYIIRYIDAMMSDLNIST